MGIDETVLWWIKRRLSVHPRLRMFLKSIRNGITRAPAVGSAGKHWGDRVHLADSPDPIGWLDCELIQREYVRPQVSGNPDLDYLPYFFQTYFRNSVPIEKILTLGCGSGRLDRVVISLNAARTITGMDISEESIRYARSKAEAVGLSDRVQYQVQDMNEVELPLNQYDCVIAESSMHHIENLEHVCDQVKHTLKSGGFFMLNEYVGPTRFQWTNAQLRLANQLFKHLPERVKRSAPVIGIGRPAIAEMVAQDPSEAVRSEEIVPTLKRYFNIVEYKPYGGTLLHLLLMNTLNLLDLEKEEDRALIRFFYSFEGEQIRSGVIGNDFAYIVCRPNDAGAQS